METVAQQDNSPSVSTPCTYTPPPCNARISPRWVALPNSLAVALQPRLDLLYPDPLLISPIPILLILPRADGHPNLLHDSIGDDHLLQDLGPIGLPGTAQAPNCDVHLVAVADELTKVSQRLGRGFLHLLDSRIALILGALDGLILQLLIPAMAVHGELVGLILQLLLLALLRDSRVLTGSCIPNSLSLSAPYFCEFALKSFISGALQVFLSRKEALDRGPYGAGMGLRCLRNLS